jgi:hypothetical protein
MIEDDRLAYILARIDHIPPSVDFEHPYAIDLERIYAAYQALAHQAADYTLAQQKAVAIRRFAVIEDEAFRQHQLAIAARDWDAVAYTLTQFKAVRCEYRNQVHALSERDAAHVRVYRESGRKAKGRPRAWGHDWPAIYHDYDAWLASGTPRALVVRRLMNTYGLGPVSLSRGLRKAGRGAHAKKRGFRKKD